MAVVVPVPISIVQSEILFKPFFAFLKDFFKAELFLIFQHVVHLPFAFAPRFSPRREGRVFGRAPSSETSAPHFCTTKPRRGKGDEMREVRP